MRVISLHRNKYIQSPFPTLNRYEGGIQFKWWLTGLTDGDGTFYVSIYQYNGYWKIIPGYSLVAGLNPANLIMLRKIRSYFNNRGHIFISKRDNTYRYTVTGLKNCIIIKNHYDQYPLMSYKWVYFKVWSNILDLLIQKEHRTKEGFLKVIALKSLFKKGLSPLLLNAFPNYQKIKLIDYNPNFSLMNLDYIIGFINADGSFGIYFKEKELKLGFKTYVTFSVQLTQHTISLPLLKAIHKFLGIGTISINSNSQASVWITRSFADIQLFINTIYDKECFLLGAKGLDFKDFVKAVKSINNKKEITDKHIKEFKLLASGMNNKRANFTDTS